MKKFVLFFILAVIACIISIYIAKYSTCLVSQLIVYDDYKINYPECLIPSISEGKIYFNNNKNVDGTIIFDIGKSTNIQISEDTLLNSKDYKSVEKGKLILNGRNVEYIIGETNDGDAIVLVDTGRSKYTIGYSGSIEEFENFRKILARFEIKKLTSEKDINPKSLYKIYTSFNEKYIDQIKALASKQELLPDTQKNMMTYENIFIKYPKELYPTISESLASFMYLGQKTGSIMLIKGDSFDIAKLQDTFSTDSLPTQAYLRGVELWGTEYQAVQVSEADSDWVRLFVDTNDVPVVLGYMGPERNLPHFLQLMNEFEIDHGKRSRSDK